MIEIPENVTQDDIQQVLNRYPTLHSCGIGYREFGMFDHKANKESREKLLTPCSLDGVKRALYFLSFCKQIKTDHNCQTSYGWKHAAEDFIGYTTNGVFIAAAVLAGIKIKQVKNTSVVIALEGIQLPAWYKSPNPVLYISVAHTRKLIENHQIPPLSTGHAYGKPKARHPQMKWA